MAFCRPERVVFESRNDLIDYVSKGIPPTQRDFTRFINTVRVPLSDEDIAESGPNDVVISDRINTTLTNDSFADVLERVYANQRHNCKVAVASFISGIVAGVVVTAKMLG